MQFGFFVKAGSQFSLYTLAGGSGSTQNLAGLRGWKTAITDWSYFSYEFTVPSGITQATVKFSTGSFSTSIAQISLIELTEI